MNGVVGFPGLTIITCVRGKLEAKPEMSNIRNSVSLWSFGCRAKHSEIGFVDNQPSKENGLEEVLPFPRHSGKCKCWKAFFVVVLKEDRKDSDVKLNGE